jgi:hypothetical protein
MASFAALKLGQLNNWWENMNTLEPLIFLHGLK